MYFNKALTNTEYRKLWLVLNIEKKYSWALYIILFLLFLNIMALNSHNGSLAENFVTKNKVEYDMP